MSGNTYTLDYAGVTTAVGRLVECGGGRLVPSDGQALERALATMPPERCAYTLAKRAHFGQDGST